MNELQTILKDLHLISEQNLSIFDINEHLIISYPTHNSPFCSSLKIIQKQNDIVKNVIMLFLKELTKRKKSILIVVFFNSMMHVLLSIVMVFI